jgi:hypothetical protein
MGEEQTAEGQKAINLYLSTDFKKNDHKPPKQVRISLTETPTAKIKDKNFKQDAVPTPPLRFKIGKHYFT